MGPPWKFQFLQDVVGQERPTIVFLCETLSNKEKMEWVRTRLGFQGMIVVEAIGRSGGLTLLWKETSQVTLRSLSKYHIDVEVTIAGLQPWRLTGFYGEPNRSQRRRTWELLRNLARDSNLPWCVIGDCNNIMAQLEKKGGALYPQWLLDGFNEVLAETGLNDLELYGHQYTWEKGRGTTSWLEIRLDRAMVTESWFDLFPTARLYNLEGTPSDHSPLLLMPTSNSTRMGKKRFRFKNAWLTEPLCKYIVSDAWEAEVDATILQKVRNCSDNLSLWGKEVTGCFGKRIKECKLKLKQLRTKRDEVSVVEYEGLKKQLFLILDQKEIFWRQRSKQLWLQAGDKNTRYFHGVYNTRRLSNTIHRLKNEAGEWVDWQNGLQNLITQFYTELFTAANTNHVEVIEVVSQSITQVDNIELLQEVTKEEVKLALFQMHPDKAPGPDGMTPAFFQKHWEIVGDDMLRMTRHFFSTGEVLQDLNTTNIVLISKKKNPTMVSELRPIALCNVLMKVITKILANRMKNMLEKVVSESQSAFIPGCLISDNIMVSYEIMHYLKKKKISKDGYMDLKLDMSKAYDRVEWDFLKAIMRKMGFSEWWVHLVLQCVTTVSYSIVHGEHEMGPIYPSRGIRQEITRDIEKSISKFWWNSSQASTSKISWISWERMAKHKSAGGMGFRNFRDFNIAMLDGDFFQAKIGNNPSFIWRSIVEAKQLLLEGVRWRIGKQWDDQMEFMNWVQMIFDSENKSKCAEVVMVCWTIWRARNDLVWNQKYTRINKIVAEAMQHLTQWNIAQSRVTLPSLQPIGEGDGVVVWVRPSTNVVKVSVDAAIFEDQNAFGFGLIARGSDGALITAKSVLHTHLVSPDLADALTIKEALSWIDRMQWPQTILESDCLVAVQAIRSNTPMRSYFGGIIEECRSMLKRLHKVSLFFVKRSANMVAHQLARESYNYPDRSFDGRTVPAIIQNCIEMDLN
ncbi:hypothetical protein AgCh_018896 [Apium graveolens]